MKLSPDYIAGFVDGEGCFALKFRKDKKLNRTNTPEYFRWSVEFAIVLRSDDREILEFIKETLDCGNISLTKDRNQVRYYIQDTEKLKKIIVPFFNTNRLYGKKHNDFCLWSEAVEIIYRNKRKSINIKKGKRGFAENNWNPNDLKRLKEIHNEMRPIKSKVKNWKWLEQST